MRYPLGIQTFREIINDNYAYVDKTEYVYKMVSNGCYYFLSRPRRFGKSLLLSTLEEYFSGSKELFEGLVIYNFESKWDSFPVLHLDFSAGDYTQDGELEVKVDSFLSRIEERYSIPKTEYPIGIRFENIIQEIYRITNKQVVILIDEYDRPLMHNLNNPKRFEEIRNKLKAFFSVMMKSQDRYIRFGFLTGVTRFGKVSVFSDLNNLTDISEHPEYSGICGITEKEMKNYFGESINTLAEYHKVSSEEMCKVLRKKYDGYHFFPHCEGVYNPYSLLNVFSSKQLDYFWFSSGTPTFLIKMLKKVNYPIGELEGVMIDTDMMKQSIDDLENSIIPVLYQSGYLTIKDSIPADRLYILGFPNDEVAIGFTKNLSSVYLPQLRETSSYFNFIHFIQDVRYGDPESFLKRMQALFSDTSYELVSNREKHFQDLTYLLFKLLGFFVEVERRTSNGRVDVVVTTPDFIYLFEMKYDKSAEEAMQQIEDKQYALPFAIDSRKLFKIGVNFDSKSNTINEWVIK